MVLLIAIPAYLGYALVGYLLTKLMFRSDSFYEDETKKSRLAFWLLALVMWPVMHTFAFLLWYSEVGMFDDGAKKDKGLHELMLKNRRKI